MINDNATKRARALIEDLGDPARCEQASYAAQHLLTEDLAPDDRERLLLAIEQKPESTEAVILGSGFIEQ